MSLQSFFDFVMETDYSYRPNEKPVFKGSYSLEKKLKEQYKEDSFIKGLYSLYDSDSKGIMVPPGNFLFL